MRTKSFLTVQVFCSIALLIHCSCVISPSSPRDETVGPLVTDSEATTDQGNASAINATLPSASQPDVEPPNPIPVGGSGQLINVAPEPTSDLPFDFSSSEFDTSLSSGDSLNLFPLSPEYDATFPDSLPFLLDSMILDLLDPIGPALPDGNTPFLERLCIALGEQDYVCRRRYGL